MVIQVNTTSSLSRSTMQSLCGDSISSRRGLLASLWALVSVLTAISFLTAAVFALSSKTSDYQNGDDDYYNRGGSQDQNIDPDLAVTSRALAFSALWTAVLSALMSVFGTVVLGWQSPTGQYYTCCSSSVHRTTPLGLGSFIGALLMLANLTLICSVLFGEFEVRLFSIKMDYGTMTSNFRCIDSGLPRGRRTGRGWKRKDIRKTGRAIVNGILGSLHVSDGTVRWFRGLNICIRGQCH